MVCDEVTLEAHTKEQWSIVTDVNKGPVEVADLLEALKSPDALRKEVFTDVEAGSANLMALVAASDGLQLTNDRLFEYSSFY